MDLASPQVQFKFPPEDLIPQLVDAYFNRHNDYAPLIHRPTFDRSLAEGLHLRDEGFATLLLLVCALGARTSTDPRVLFEGYSNYHSAGFEWFKQAADAFHVVKRSLRLYDLQNTCVSTGTFAPCLFLSTRAAKAAFPLPSGGITSSKRMADHRHRYSLRSCAGSSSLEDVRVGPDGREGANETGVLVS